MTHKFFLLMVLCALFWFLSVTKTIVPDGTTCLGKRSHFIILLPMVKALVRVKCQEEVLVMVLGKGMVKACRGGGGYGGSGEGRGDGSGYGSGEGGSDGGGEGSGEGT
ncbi:hypothetical protein H5410_039124 [Solanum commersonii]|uniref:Glycine-rich protein n=1 Tax=Solanum commersonii TaxID=4109 RepID=A0A9J5YF58_SOLCO|nr:hypothetical protein H5410_039124 [Solanum commersonii]